MASPNRTCYVCGERYYFCSSYHCDESRGKPRWMVMFHSENCLTIWNIVSDHFYGKVTDAEAREKLLACDLRGLDSFREPIRTDIRRILGLSPAKPAGD